jgi:NTE family protein
MTAPPPFDRGFTLALGGGGARGWAHIGVARALREAGMRPRRIVGTSMGAIIGAGLAAERDPEAIEEVARRTGVYRLVGKRARLALFDPRPLLDVVAHGLGDPRIEDLPIPFGVTTYDLVSGRPKLITEGSLTMALERSIAVPLFFPPCTDKDGVWCDAGPWESVPVTLAREWDPDLPVIGVQVDVPKPAMLASRFGAAILRAAAERLGIGANAPNGTRLTARRFLALLATRWAEPVVCEEPELLIEPNLGWANALQFSRLRPIVESGERDARRSLAAIGALPGERKAARAA